MLDKLIWFVYTNNIVKRERENMTDTICKVKIIKDTWAHSKKCWFIVDVKYNYTLNYTGYSSKKAALKSIENVSGMELI